ncbi:hypothetical protein Vadar_020030 [Vaccinium darrowii]|uniref:Uncharacterized protein n=1 Tax=Vaccinium darrowii TaxID=229202 RepID=A0ACB7XB57_9ERIC|nr:hypothetical protein Vadar_020030 [Vaccinium darrowii]
MAPFRVADGDRSGSRRRRLRKRYSSELSGSSSDSEKKGKIEVMEDVDYRYYGNGSYLCLSPDDSDQGDSDEGDRKMTKAEHEIYNKQILETGGFDVDVPPGVSSCCLILPQPNFEKDPLLFKEVKRCARNAIEFYNQNHKANYRFLRVVKLASAFCDGNMHYITFEANAKGAAPMCFQAEVSAGFAKSELNVIMCRRKP